MASQSLLATLAIFSSMILSMPVYGQINNAPCTASMLTSFTPCMNFLTSGSNITSPPPDCCSSIKSLMANGTGCFCQVATGMIPFTIPINRTTAISLPTACNMPSVPFQCQTSGTPAPAPGIAAGGPSMSPEIVPSATPEGSVIPVSPASAPGVDYTPATSEAPTANSARPPSHNPAASSACSHSSSSMLLLAILGAIALNYY